LIGSIPERALSTHAKILQDEPHTRLAFCIVERGGTDRRLPDEVAGVVRVRVLRRRSGLDVVVGIWRGIPRCCLIWVILWLPVRVGRCSHWLAVLVDIVLHLRRHKQWPVWLWRERSGHTTRDAYCRRGVAVPDQIACAANNLLLPEVDDERVEGSVDLVGIDLLSCRGVAQYQADARRRSDGAAVLSLATCLSSVPLPKQWMTARVVLPCRQNHTFGLGWAVAQLSACNHVSLQAESVRNGYTPVGPATVRTNVVAIRIVRRSSVPIQRLHRLHLLHLLRRWWWLVVLLLLCRRW
jgi:hypothetical protein